ncbi:uncharacterized protein LOC114285080 isoform X2 [Camellia sinensis]|uniref:uncharacterized protein LOC114285080 isoform X2 n=1 Tax=Camellia sinensis TaxID=4442 RepID=UPI001036C370|nr:uncharacterized protein LOC114285080 isoform X2 [Camellia sinensis]
MFGDREETPTRYELLSMVKKHSKLLGKTNVDDEDASDVETDPRFWHDVMDLYFICGRESRGRQDDDLVFFVRKMSLHGHGFSDNMEGNSPYFVRRWAPKFNDLVDKNSVDVDWRRSFYLNLIAHTSFSVTVAICSHQVLRNHQSGEDAPLSSIYKVLTDTDHCYCVLLNADGGAAFPSEKPAQDCSSSDISSLRTDTGSEQTNKTKLTLFSGFVSYQMVRDAYEAGKSGFGSFLSLGHSPEKADRIYMKGPGGRGEVEVAVSGVLDQSKQVSGPSSPTSKSGFATIVRRAANAASVAAKHAYAAAAATRGPDEEMMPLKCCLMSVSLPWEHIASDLLFKGSPPVNL